MKKIFKKSLALTLALCCCLSAMLCCFTVNAENQPSVVISSVEAAPGSQVDVEVAFTDLTKGVCAMLDTVQFPDGFVINSVANQDADSPLQFQLMDPENGGNVLVDGGTVKFVEFVNFPEEITIDSLTIVINVTVPEEAGTYDITMDVDAASYEEELTDVAITNGQVTVAQAHEHSYTEEITTEPTCTQPGVKTFTCDCGDSYTEAIPATGHVGAEAVVENQVSSTCAVKGHYDEVVYCSVCGEELSRETFEMDLADEHGETAVRTENNVPASCTEPGSYDKVTYCTVCDTVLSRETVPVDALGHVDADNDNICDRCEENLAPVGPVYDESLKITAKTGLFQSDYSLLYYIPKSLPDGWYIAATKAKYKGGSSTNPADANVQLEDETIILTIDNVYHERSVNGVPQYGVALKGISAREIASKITVTLHKVVDGVDYYGDTQEYNLITYATNRIASANASDSEKKAMAALLNYGAEAQKRLYYNTNNLANASLTDEQKAVEPIGDVIDISTDDKDYGIAKVYGFAPSYRDKMTLVTVVDVPENYAELGLKVKFEYENVNGAQIEYMNLADSLPYNNTKYRKVEFASLAIRDVRTPVTVTVVDADDKLVSNTRKYSFESYAAKNVGKADGPVSRAMIAFGDWFKASKS